VLSYDRYRLTSDALSLRRDDKTGVIDLSGSARLALCPCDDPPVSIGVSAARLDADRDLFLRWPRLYVGPVPVFVLPWLWLRPADRPGLLPPFAALRGADGFLIGAGARLPWRGDDAKLRAIELRAAGYVKGGVEVSARLDAPTATGKIVWDHLREDRFVATSHGSLRSDARSSVVVAWDLDVLRGARGLRATPSLAEASSPFDVGAAEISVSSDLRGARVSLGTGVALRAPRALGNFLGGPIFFTSIGGSAGSSGAWRTSLGFAMLGGAPLGRVDASVEGTPLSGPLAVRTRLSSRARLAALPEEKAASGDVVAEARVEASVPLVRVFSSSTTEAPIVHRVAPTLEIRAAAAREVGKFFSKMRPPLGPVVGLAALGATSSLGRAYAPSLDADARVGFLLSPRGALLLGWMSVEGAHDLFRARAEASASKAVTETSSSLASGLEAMAELGLGRSGGASVSLDAYGRTSASSGFLSRSLDPSGFLLGDAIGLLRGPGLYLGGAASTPLSRPLRASARVDVDARAARVLGARGSIGYLHPNGCLALELGLGARVGRPGVDAWLAVDLVPPLASR